MFVQRMYWPAELEWLLDFSSAKQKVHSIYPEVLEGLFSNLFEGCCDVGHGFVLILLMVNRFVLVPPGQKDGTFNRPTRFFLACYSSVNRPPPICCTIGRVFRHIVCKYMNMMSWTDNIFRDRCAFIASGAMVIFLCCSRLRQLIRNPQHRTLSLYMNLSACRLVLPVANIYIFPQVSFLTFLTSSKCCF